MMDFLVICIIFNCLIIYVYGGGESLAYGAVRADHDNTGWSLLK